MANEDLKINYLPAIGLNEAGKIDFFWGDATRALETIDTIVIHSMFNYEDLGDEQYSAEACRDLLIRTRPGLSTHYFVDRDGEIWQCVDEVRMAWHAGKSRMPEPDNRERVNGFSVGIELIGNETDGFTLEQYQALAGLVVQIMDRLPIENILGHSDIAGSGVRPDDPKTDPWNFDWSKFLILLSERIGEDKVGELKLTGGR